MELQFVSIHGHRLGLRLAGQGPVLLLIHGMASSSAAWTPVIPALAERFTVLAPDLLGHGTSAKPAADYSLGAHASLLRDLCVLLGHERATVVGHSFGGGVALQFAYQFPERCERLVLVGSGGLGREVTPLLRALALPGSEHVLPLFCAGPLRDAGTAVANGLWRVGVRASAAAQEIWRGYASLADADARIAFFRTLRSVVDIDGQNVSADDRLHLAADLPTLIVWGARDPIIPVAHAHRAHAAILGSQVAIFEGVGHFPHCEAPERFAATLLDFLRSTEPVHLSAQQLRPRLRGVSA
jgi:pimeloyl-ACP methyl ester carboxylesterase